MKDELLKKVMEYYPEKLLEIHSLLQNGMSVKEIEDIYFPVSPLTIKSNFSSNASLQQAYYDSLSSDEKITYNWNDLGVVMKHTLGEQLTEKERQYLTKCYPVMMLGDENE